MHFYFIFICPFCDRPRFHFYKNINSSAPKNRESCGLRLTPIDLSLVSCDLRRREEDKKMRLVITEDGAGAAQWVAAHVKRRITEFAPTADRPFVLGLPTGSSPISTYKVPWRTQHRTRHHRTTRTRTRTHHRVHIGRELSALL
jgi:hypothetical protein